jgi:Tfp pilus assembly protein PilO
MISRLITYLGAMPAQRIYLLAGGVPLIAAAAFFSLALPSFKALQAVRVERLQHRQQGMDSATLEQSKRQLAAEIDRMSAGTPADVRSAEQLAVHVVGQLDRASVRSGVVLSSVTPGAVRKVTSFDEIPFDVEVKGSYRDLIGWLDDLERTVDKLAVIRADMRPGDGGKLIEMKARVALYR